jgi:hypothetical protein
MWLEDEDKGRYRVVHKDAAGRYEQIEGKTRMRVC